MEKKTGLDWTLKHYIELEVVSLHKNRGYPFIPPNASQRGILGHLCTHSLSLPPLPLHTPIPWHQLLFWPLWMPPLLCRSSHTLLLLLIDCSPFQQPTSSCNSPKAIIALGRLCGRYQATLPHSPSPFQPKTKEDSQLKRETLIICHC